MKRTVSEQQPGEQEKRPKDMLNVICGNCHRAQVHAVPSAERVLVRCENCGMQILVFYSNPAYQAKGETSPQEDNPFQIKESERVLLQQVGEQAQTLYVFLRRYVWRYGYAPTLREMQLGIGWQSVNAVRYHLQQLEGIGLIERDYATSRGIRLLVA